MKQRLSEFASKHNEKVLETKKNTISLGMSLNSLKELFSEDYQVFYFIK